MTLSCDFFSLCVVWCVGSGFDFGPERNPIPTLQHRVGESSGTVRENAALCVCLFRTWPPCVPSLLGFGVFLPSLFCVFPVCPVFFFWCALGLDAHTVREESSPPSAAQSNSCQLHPINIRTRIEAHTVSCCSGRDE